MQDQNIWIFTEHNKDDESFLQAIQNPENAVIFLTQKGRGQILQEHATIALVRNSIVFFEPNYIETVEKITTDFEMKVMVYKKEYLRDVNIKVNKLKIFK